jgi:hypothetical protein
MPDLYGIRVSVNDYKDGWEIELKPDWYVSGDGDGYGWMARAGITDQQADDAGRSLTGVLARIFAVLCSYSRDEVFDYWPAPECPQLKGARVVSASLGGPCWPETWVSVTFDKRQKVTRKVGKQVVSEVVQRVMSA